MPPSSPRSGLRLLLERQLAGTLPAEPALVLVTDLDGTLLGGDPAWRRAFYSWLEAERHRVLHLFSTGRDLRSVQRLLKEEAAMGLGAPHLVIGDVGCSVACGQSMNLVPLAVDPIEARWQGLAERLLPLLAELPGISPQPVTADRRLAYLIDPSRIDRARIQALEVHGVDCLVSDNKYLDVLPAGVNKGTTLLAVLDLLEVDPSRVVTAGDTLNDLAMFETGLAGVMVANAEPALQQMLPQLPNTYRARGEGCEGIVEGLRYFGFGSLLEAWF